MKKDIEWLKREIPNLRGYAVLIDGEDGEWEPVTTVSMEDIYELINQLDKLEFLSQEWIDEHRESTFDLDEDFETVFIKVEKLQNLLVPKQEEVDRAYKDGYEKGREYGFYKGYREGLGNKGGEPEVLSLEWIERNKESFYHFENEKVDHYVSTDDLQNLLVPKQELPVIPKFVAEAIEEDKECGYDVYESIDLIIGTNGGGLPSLSDWVARNIDKYARAYLGDYTVEEEPLYRARLKVITDEFIASYLRTQSSDAEDRLKALEIGSKYIHEDYRHLSEFTEDELKRLDIWDSNQWELEELEE